MVTTKKTYVRNGVTYNFNHTYFNNLFIREAKKRKIKYGKFEELLGEAIYVEKSTVHAWRNKINAPGDLEKIGMIARFLDVECSNLLVETMEEGGTEMNNAEDSVQVVILKDREKEAFKKVYLQLLNATREARRYYTDLMEKDKAFEEERERCWENEFALELAREDEEYDVGFLDYTDCIYPDYTEMTETYNEISKPKYIQQMKEAYHVIEDERLDLPAGLFDELKKLADITIVEFGALNTDFKVALFALDYYSSNAKSLVECLKNIDVTENYYDEFCTLVIERIAEIPEALKEGISEHIENHNEKENICLGDIFKQITQSINRISKTGNEELVYEDFWIAFHKNEAEHLSSITDSFHERIGNLMEQYR